MYITLIITFLLMVIVIVPGIQNNIETTLKFFFWEIEAPLTSIIFYSALLGAATVAVLILPKLARKYLDVRNLKKQLSAFKEKEIKAERDSV